MDCSLPGSSAHGIFQAIVLEWGAIAHISLSIPRLRRDPKLGRKSSRIILMRYSAPIKRKILVLHVILRERKGAREKISTHFRH